jgi:hypothetical protein
MSRALLLQALDALQEIQLYILSTDGREPYKKLDAGIEAITAALAQPEPEPFAWHFQHECGRSVMVDKLELNDDWERANSQWHKKGPLYITPTKLDTHQNLDSYAEIKQSFEKIESEIVAELVNALRGVIRVADRATDEFDAARAAIEKATKKQQRPLIFIDSPYLDKDSNWANYSDPITPLWAFEKRKKL